MKRLKQIFTNQQYIYWLFVFMAILPNIFMFFTESTSLLTRIVQIVLPLGFFGFMFTVAKKPGKMFWVLFWFMFVGAFQIVLLWLYGESPIAVDMFLNVLTTNPGEASELLENLLVAVIFVVLVYGFGIAMSIVSWRAKTTLSERFRRIQRMWSLPVLGVGALLMIINVLCDRNFKIQDDIFPINGTYNVGIAINRYAKQRNYENTSKNFTYKATNLRQDSVPEIYVLVIGETSRADNWSLYGYNRNTNPGTSALDGLVVYRDALTMSNTTHKSVPMLMSCAACEQYDSLYYRKGIITAYKEAGYQTAFYSNQRRNHSFIDAFGNEAHEVKFLKENASFKENIFDDELIDCVKQRLDKYVGGKLFIVVHMYGSHFNYKDRYPKNEAVFTPDNVISAERVYREQLINAYDNSIVNTDKVLASIIRLVDSKGVNSAVIFTSDHGEDIFDDERGRFLHASPLPTYYQIHVPLLVWTSQTYRSNYPDAVAQLQAHKAIPVSTNMVVFHTLLDLSGIQSPYKKDSLSLSNKGFKPHKRLYINDHNEFLPLDNCGLKQLDIDQFKKHNLQFP
ncbi:MAG: lipid A phosphoethanolamine transferase [Muribaculaceae bacterium]|nr:lipid A phosphoethanolamine transferase [Muribaculaceae bacterium]